MMTHDEMIAVIQHHRDGGKVEFQTRSLGKDSSWEEINEPSWDFHASNYRAKSEPMVIYVEVSNVTNQPLRVKLSSDMTCDYTNTTIKKFIEATE